MSNSEKLNELPTQLNLTKLPLNDQKVHKLNKDCPWVKVLLMELNEKATTKDPEDYLSNTHLNIELKIEKKFSTTLGEFLLLEFSLEALFITECVKTLEEMQDSIELAAKCCFIEEHFAEAPEYADQTDIYIESDMYELYFYENRKVEIKEMLHEQIYLNVNQYPSLDQDTHGRPAKEKDTLH